MQLVCKPRKLKVLFPDIAAYAYKKSNNQPFIEPRDDLKYIPNFLHMMFSTPQKEYAYF